ncbi:MAG: hypothetical protein M9947_02390 [Thermomicrobiales bacterium]|nr:hypothetical protein [Thermomicrobiales bacterium]
MNEQDSAEIIEVDRPVTDPEIELAVTQEPDEPEGSSNPDSWLQWAIIIGLLALLLICAILILIGWNNR